MNETLRHSCAGTFFAAAAVFAQYAVKALNPTLRAGWSDSLNTDRDAGRDFSTRLVDREIMSIYLIDLLRMDLTATGCDDRIAVAQIRAAGSLRLSYGNLVYNRGARETCMRTALFSACLIVIVLPLVASAKADAQTMSPSWHPTMAGQGMVLHDMNKAQNRRLRDRGHSGGASAREALSPEARSTCLNKRRAIALFGANDPRTRRLYALCAQAGY